MVNYGNVSGAVTDLDPPELGEAASLFLTRPRPADHMADAASVQGWADAVFAGILEGALSIEIVGRCTLEAVNPVQAAIEGRTQIGKATVCL